MASRAEPRHSQIILWVLVSGAYANQINRDGKAGDNGEAAQTHALQQFRGQQRNQKGCQNGLYGRVGKQCVQRYLL
jgi:hypothetical protein